MNKMKSITHTTSIRLVCDWTNEKRYVTHYRMLKVYFKLGMVAEKVHGVVSLRQNRWLKLYIDFNTSKLAAARNDFDEDLPKYLNCCFYGKTMENVKNRTKKELISRNDDDKAVKMQSKGTFNEIQKSYDNYDSYTFQYNEILMDKPLYLGFVMLE